jgi:glycosidase
MKYYIDPDHTINKRLHRLYPPDIAEKAIESIADLIYKYRQRIQSEPYHLSEKDVILITYGDQLKHAHEAPLSTLKEFLDKYVEGVINSVHILPFCPSSSDDGFSVVNYSQVDPHMGSWREIDAISDHYRLMVDGVINHVSQFSDWFQAYLAGDPFFKDFFIDLDPSTDLSNVVRPRSSPLLNEFTDDEGKIHNIWTTFSKDQVDLNYANYRVLRAVLDALFYYIEKGATLIRLDAIAFLWKEAGTECVHLPQTHELVQLIREVLHEVAPEVIIITETNVPHHENISYFGSGDDEAQMVYNFALPPLLVHSILHRDTTSLTKWARGLELPSDKVCFFNFTASHDGCGLRPVKGILSDDEINYLVNTTREHGGLISYRRDQEGGKSPYELNCSYIDLLTHPDDDDQLRIKRMLLSQAVVLAMPGVPGIYFHSLVGSRNYHEGVKVTGFHRSINREKFNMNGLEKELNSEGSLQKAIYQSYKRLISIRINESAFNPFGPFEFLDLHHRIFALLQISKERDEEILTLHNFANKDVGISIPESVDLPLTDLISGEVIEFEREIMLAPYQIMWLKKKI